MTIEIGQQAPDFTLKNQHGEDVSLAALRGRTVVLVFYPFAFTGVCTGELCELRDNLADLTADGKIRPERIRGTFLARGDLSVG